MRTSTRSTRRPSAWRETVSTIAWHERELVHHVLLPGAVRARSQGSRHCSRVDHEPGARLDDLGDGLQRGLRDLADARHTGVHTRWPWRWSVRW